MSRPIVPSEFYEGIARTILDHGQQLIGVYPTADDASAPFQYTIGNHERGLPELLVVGAFWHVAIGQLLNILSRMQQDRGQPFEDQEKVALGGDFPAAMMRPDQVTVRASFTIQAGQYYQTDQYDVLQAVLCDKTGRYPWEEGCDPAFAAQIAETSRTDA